MSFLLDALTTLSAIADAPGSIVRNTLAGTNPFQGLFHPEDRTSGRDLLEQWGAVGENTPGFDMGDLAGFGVDVVADPLSILGLGKAATGLGRMAGRYADEAVKAPTLGVFGGAFGDFSKYGAKPRMLPPKEAQEIFQPWAKSLTPEEAEAMRLFTTGPQEAISGVLRGVPDVEFPGAAPIGVHSPLINSPERVMDDVVPYADSAMSKGQGVNPYDIVTYRAADRHGAMNAGNARDMIGQTVMDPSYLSTTVNPYGSFYGVHPVDDSLRLDIILPKGSPSAYPNAGQLSGYPGEQELMLPRGLPMEVLDVESRQVAKIPGVGGVRPIEVQLTPSGVPVPIANHMPTDKTAAQIFNLPALDDYLKQTGAYVNRAGHNADTHTRFPMGTWAEPVPSELLAKGWEDVIAKAPKTDFLNVLLKAKPEELPALLANPSVRRLLDDEKLNVLQQILPAVRKVARNPEMFERRVKNALDYGGPNPSAIQLDHAMNHALGFTEGKLHNLLKQSVSKDQPVQGMLEILKKAGIPIAGVGGAMSPLLDAILSQEAA